MKAYDTYKKDILESLIEKAGKTWNDGIWARNSKYVEYKHILPLPESTKANKAKAIEEYLKFDCKRCLPDNLKGLHQDVHHLNSSQLLCMMFFSQLIDDDHKATEKMVKFIKDAFEINIHVGAKCSFEYTEDFPPYIFTIGGKQEYEGTSFDFHIEDGQTQIYFEIKLTEYGFGKVSKPDPRHREKAEQYVKLLPSLYKDVTPEKMLENYQIFRNVIRAKNENAYVIFITDGNNPKTKTEAENFEELFGKVSNVKFVTWQEIMPAYQENCELPFQLKAIKYIK